MQIEKSRTLTGKLNIVSFILKEMYDVLVNNIVYAQNYKFGYISHYFYQKRLD